VLTFSGLFDPFYQYKRKYTDSIRNMNAHPIRAAVPADLGDGILIDTSPPPKLDDEIEADDDADEPVEKDGDDSKQDENDGSKVEEDDKNDSVEETEKDDEDDKEEDDKKQDNNEPKPEDDDGPEKETVATVVPIEDFGTPTAPLTDGPTATISDSIATLTGVPEVVNSDGDAAITHSVGSLPRLLEETISLALTHMSCLTLTVIPSPVANNSGP
jgi:hypothetical protein